MMAVLARACADHPRSTGREHTSQPSIAFSRSFAFRIAALCAAVLAFIQVAAAQSGDPKAGDQQRAQQAGDSAKDAAKKIDEFAEAAKMLGGPAANPECVWLGRRVVNLLWRDDLDTAFRHLDLYDRFGCPGGHMQATFRCVVRQGSIDPKGPESLAARACLLDQPEPAARRPRLNHRRDRKGHSLRSRAARHSNLRPAEPDRFPARWIFDRSVCGAFKTPPRIPSYDCLLRGPVD